MMGYTSPKISAVTSAGKHGSSGGCFLHITFSKSGTKKYSSRFGILCGCSILGYKSGDKVNISEIAAQRKVCIKPTYSMCSMCK